MTPFAANLDLTPRSAPPAEDMQLTAVQSKTEVSSDSASAPAERSDEGQPTAARLFLDRLGLIEKMGPIRELNQEIRLEHPQMDNLYQEVESRPELLKRFLKFANSSWFNSRVQVDSPVMAFSRFGTAGFYRLTLATFLQD